MLRVSPASLVKAHGPGLSDGLFDKSDFVIEADDPGLGQGDVKVRVGGPKGIYLEISGLIILHGSVSLPGEESSIVANGARFWVGGGREVTRNVKTWYVFLDIET